MKIITKNLASDNILIFDDNKFVALCVSYLNDKCYVIKAKDNNDNNYLIARYESKEVAEKVIEQIIEAYENDEKVFYMPE